MSHDLETELAALATEHANPERSELDALETPHLVFAMLEDSAGVQRAIRSAVPQIARAVDGISERMSAGGRLVTLGAGTSGRLAVLDASECPPTFGTDPSQVVGIIAGGDTALRNAVEGAEDDVDAGALAIADLAVRQTDAAVGVSASGRTPFVIGALDEAHRRGALTISLACNEPSKAAIHADIAIDLATGPEFIAGSTRLNAGTAQKIVLNMLSTLTMVRLGKTFGNIMVDVQATNEKLAVRARRTVMQVTGSPREAADGALQAANGSVKTAILMLLADLDARAASTRLAAHGGHLRAALRSM